MVDYFNSMETFLSIDNIYALHLVITIVRTTLITWIFSDLCIYYTNLPATNSFSKVWPISIPINWYPIYVLFDEFLLEVVSCCLQEPRLGRWGRTPEARNGISILPLKLWDEAMSIVPLQFWLIQNATLNWAISMSVFIICNNYIHFYYVSIISAPFYKNLKSWNVIPILKKALRARKRSCDQFIWVKNIIL